MDIRTGLLLFLWTLSALLHDSGQSHPFIDFFFTQEPKDIVIEKGHNAVLNCSVHHSPGHTVEISWMRDGEIINFEADQRRRMLENGSLYITNVLHTRSQRPDEGVYQCMAAIKGVGSILSKAAKLQIAYMGRDFKFQPESKKFHLGDTAMFPCIIDGQPKPEVLWYKDDLLIQERLDSVNHVLHSDGILEIRELKFHDFGSYKCKATNTDRSRFSQVASITQNPNTDSYQGVAPSFIMKPMSQTVLLDQDVVLYCGANGRDRQGHVPTITWLKDGVTVDMSHLDTRYTIIGTGSLKISKITESDRGSYTCRATNLEESEDADATLIIHVPPTFQRTPVNKIANTNEDVLLNCDVKGIPEPTVRWLKNGEIIVANDYFQVADGKHLRILGLVKEDWGMYQCFAENEVSNIQASAQLIVQKRAMDPTAMPDLTTLPLLGSTPVAMDQRPSKPQDLIPVLVSTRFITLTWKVPLQTGPTEITEYSVFWKEFGSDRERVMNTSTPEANIQHLKPATKYEFKVLAYNRLGPGHEYATTTLETQPEVHVPGPVMHVVVTVLSPRSISLAWDPPIKSNGAILHYKLYYYEAGAETENDIDLTAMSHTLVNLRPFTAYKFRIVAYNSNGRGISTDDYTSKTYSDVPSETPKNVTVDAESSNSLIVKWQPPPEEKQNGIITGYKIRYRKTGSRRGGTQTTDGFRRMYTITELHKNSRYQLKIAALTVNGTGPFTDWMVANTHRSDRDESRVPNQPSSLRVRPFTNSIVVSWTPPSNEDVVVRGYQLSYGIGHPDGFSLVLGANKRIYTIEDLKPSSEYVIRLQAYNEKGNGRAIYETVITREDTTPEPSTPMVPPLGVRAIVLSPTTIVVTWADSSLGRNQHIMDNRYYTVRFGPADSRKYKHINSTDLNLHIDDLRPNTQYEFSVKVIKGRRKSIWSMSVLNTTFEAAPFSSPRDLTPVRAGERATDVTINWQPPRLPNGHITGYLIFYTKDASQRDREWAVEGVLGDQLSTTIRDLEPDTTYYFKIQARNSKGYGPMSNIVVFHTAKGSPISTGPNILWIVIGCIGGVTLIGIIVALVVIIVKRNGNSNHNRNAYKPSSKMTGQPDIKPPDLWIHHDQVELKNIDKDSERASMNVTPIRRDSNDYENDNRNSYRGDYSNDGSDRLGSDRYYRPVARKPMTFPVEPTARDPLVTATAIPNGHLDHSIRPSYPRTQYNTQYTNSPRVHAGDVSQPSSVKPQQATSPLRKNTTPPNVPGFPAKSRSPLPVITPRCPDMMSTMRSNSSTGSRSGNESEVPKSSSAEELSAEMANLEGIMKDLTAITQNEFEC